MMSADLREWQLDFDSTVPLHMQFEQHIRQKIDSGEWKAGDKIPSERELMQLANISRSTVRQALSALEHRDILEKIHGRGTFVRHSKYEQPLELVYSFSEQMRAIGETLEDRLLKCEVIDATPDLAAKLRIGVSDPVIHLKRLRITRGIPMMVSIAYVPYDLCPGLLHESFEGSPSLYRILTTTYNLPVVRAVDRLEAIVADNTMAQLLQIPRRTPLMYVERVAITSHDTVLHMGYNYIRGDMCSFRSEMHAQPTLLELKRLP